MGKRLNREPIIIHWNGRTIEAVPCSHKHRALFEAGYLVLSCSRCSLRRVHEMEDA